MKKELNMPKTDFTQRSNSQEREPQLLNLWKDTFQQRNKLNNGDTFTLHDGPPYANGDVHVGHVLNKVLKDMVSKYHLMKGYKVDFRPGFDCHGLPTEMGVQKKFGKNLSTKELRDKCKDWANNFTEKQKETFKTLGVLADWDNLYQTMTPQYETQQLKVLYKLLNDKLLYQDKRPVYYSPSSQTVLAESELEYRNRKDKSAYFTLDLVDSKLLLWTTQPWTVLGNKAVCVHPKFTYYKVKYNETLYVVGENALKLLPDCVVVETFLGKDLNGLQYTNTLTNEKGVLVCSDFVKFDSGTGLVHLCPAHGEEDYDVCLKHKLYGEDLTDNYGMVNGLFCLDDASNDVLSKMKECDMLFKSEEYEHSYPHDWRTGKPVYFRLTEQFFLDLTDLKNKALQELDKVEFSQEKWKNRLTNTVKQRSRWCLSRQRKWGFPLAVFLKDGKPFLNTKLESHLSNLFSEHGSNCWFDMTEDELLPDEFKSMGLVKCSHTLDVWFDSGVSWLSVVGGKSDVYFEGSDQHRGWFQSSLLTSVAMTGEAPYKRLLTHGFVLDEHGRKMSKSVGNVVEPKTVQSKYNSDVLRLWTAVVNYSDDAQLGDKVLQNCADYYFKLRNTMKYLLGNMWGYNLDYNPELTEKEVKALQRCDDMYNNSMKYYSEFNFRKVFEELMSWVTDLSSQYLDVETKSYLYEYSLDSDERQRCQYTMKYCLERYMKVLAPMCSFLAEDAYQNYEFKKYDSVFMELLN